MAKTRLKQPKHFVNQLREYIEDLQITLRVLTTLGGMTNGHAPHTRALDVAEAALDAHTTKRRTVTRRTVTRRGPGRPKGSKTKRKLPNWNPGKAKPLPEVKLPAGLSLEGHDVRDAIGLALKAYKRPASTMELAALLVAGGYKMPDHLQHIPVTRYIGQNVGGMALVKGSGVKKTREGWTTR